MATAPCKSAALLAPPRPATSANDRRLSRLHKRTVCCHRGLAQYARLKASKRTVDNDRKQNIMLRVFECGHVYKWLWRIGRHTRGRKEKTKGICGECWRYMATDGRRMITNGARSRRCRRRSIDSSLVSIDDPRGEMLKGKIKAR
ncbi:hypothetical protein GGS21DRAFT_161371 [Xylaria nigripes]|nr:hypothetical protein GGS21DRAFT_161371 [Xylaria nigripes]